MNIWNVYIKNENDFELIDIVYGYPIESNSAEEVKQSLVEHDCYDPQIRVVNDGLSLKLLNEVDEDVILNTEYFYLEAIKCGILDAETLEFCWG